ncbi:hypothetical protein ABQY74_001920 [Xanthomonas sp. WHRI 7064]|uniref:hypothetical protein n=1 Tax=Xanthomonas sp. WHRI 7064 TaxID=3161568 RepID=UPI0032E874D8
MSLYFFPGSMVSDSFEPIRASRAALIQALDTGTKLMRGEIEDWKNGWYGVTLGVSVTGIDRMIGLLTRLRDDPDQHFHVSSDYSGSGGLGDIEVYVAEADATSNMQIVSYALAPGNETTPNGP